MTFSASDILAVQRLYRQNRHYENYPCLIEPASSVALGLASGPQARPGWACTGCTDGLQGPRAWLWFLRGPSPWPTERIPASQFEVYH
jgi:hypothetical protein